MEKKKKRNREKKYTLNRTWNHMENDVPCKQSFCLILRLVATWDNAKYEYHSIRIRSFNIFFHFFFSGFSFRCGFCCFHFSSVLSISFKFGDYILSLAFISKRRIFLLFFSNVTLDPCDTKKKNAYTYIRSRWKHSISKGSCVLCLYIGIDWILQSNCGKQPNVIV